MWHLFLVLFLAVCLFIHPSIFMELLFIYLFFIILIHTVFVMILLKSDISIHYISHTSYLLLLFVYKKEEEKMAELLSLHLWLHNDKCCL